MVSYLDQFLETLRNRSSFLIFVFAFGTIYCAIAFSLDLTVPPDPIDPDILGTFHIWSPYQSLGFALLGIFFLIILILIDPRERQLDLKGLIYGLPVACLSFLIIHTWDPGQITTHFPFLSILYGFDPNNYLFIGPILIYGAILGIFITYFSGNAFQLPQKSEKEDSLINVSNTLINLLLKSILVIFLFPVILLLPLLIIASFLLLYLFPTYGEGTFGGILVVITLMAMYIGARFFDISSVKLSNLTAKDWIIWIFRLIIEGITLYTCLVGAFSIMGGFISDGTPPSLLVTPIFLVYTFLLTLPFSLFLARNKIFPPKKQPPKPIIGKARSEITINLEELSDQYKIIDAVQILDNYGQYQVKKIWGIILLILGILEIMQVFYYLYLGLSIWLWPVYRYSLLHYFILAGFPTFKVSLIPLYLVYRYNSIKRPVNREGIFLPPFIIDFKLALFSLWCFAGLIPFLILINNMILGLLIISDIFLMLGGISLLVSFFFLRKVLNAIELIELPIFGVGLIVMNLLVIIIYILL
ncbi:MAG: hypothetical protein ACFFC7_30425, partial [Candidatus Hermodarchaeota archaeon]